MLKAILVLIVLGTCAQSHAYADRRCDVLEVLLDTADGRDEKENNRNAALWEDLECGRQDGGNINFEYVYPATDVKLTK